MRRMKRVLAVMSVIVVLVALSMPTAAASKTLGQCPSCKQGALMYVRRLPVCETLACVEYKFETRYGPNGQYSVRVEHRFHYEYDLYRCPHCKYEKKNRVKVYDKMSTSGYLL